MAGPSLHWSMRIFPAAPPSRPGSHFAVPGFLSGKKVASQCPHPAADPTACRLGKGAASLHFSPGHFLLCP